MGFEDVFLWRSNKTWFCHFHEHVLENLQYFYLLVIIIFWRILISGFEAQNKNQQGTISGTNAEPVPMENSTLDQIFTFRNISSLHTLRFLIGMAFSNSLVFDFLALSGLSVFFFVVFGSKLKIQWKFREDYIDNGFLAIYCILSKWFDSICWCLLGRPFTDRLHCNLTFFRLNPF